VRLGEGDQRTLLALPSLQASVEASDGRIAMDDNFYLCWNPQGRPPIAKHETFEQAAAEAKRLSRNEGGAKIYVLQSIGYAEIPSPPVEFINIQDKEES
jgi:hypothetical protein